MRLAAMIANMRDLNRRKLAGLVVENEYKRQALTREQAADAMKMAPGTLDRIRKGDSTLTPSRLRAAEGALGLTDLLLDLIIEGDAVTIASLSDDEIRPGMKRTILAGLARIEAEEVEGHEHNNNHKAQ